MYRDGVISRGEAATENHH
ncbi:hypothetical protein A2U01_0105051, partial [Trifolium medium]|nr:hypothetical protein [Trifolium medium]